MSSQTTEFAAWLNSLIGEGRRFESNRAFADAAGISEKSVRRYLDGAIPTNIRTLQKISTAVPETSMTDLQRLAGILPEDPDEQRVALLKALENVFNRLPEEDQEFLLDMAKRMLERQRQTE